MEVSQQILYLSLGNKIHPIINHFNAALDKTLSTDIAQSTDKNITKFKGKDCCKQYLQLKPINSCYLYETHLYLQKKQETEYNLDEIFVLNFSQSLRDTYCTLYFNNFFDSPALIAKLFDDGVYGIGTVRSKIPDDENME